MNAKSFLLFLALFFISSLSAIADEVCRPCPFSCRLIQISERDCSDRNSNRGLCCVDLDDRGQEQLRRQSDAHYGRNRHYDDDDFWNSNNDSHHHRNDNWGSSNWDRRGEDWRDWDRENRAWRDRWEREQAERYEDRRRRDPGSYDDRYGYQPGDCPLGYHVNDRECTFDERQRGCSDLRSRSGQVCVGWNVRRR